VTDAPRTPYDGLPIEIRRANWGWFGPAWPSGICYDDDGRLIIEMHKPFPTGESCLFCGEQFDEAAGDAGTAMPNMAGTGRAEIRHVHKECSLQDVVGSLAHLEGRCRCQGGGTETPGLTPRQEALAVWKWVQRHGVGNA
jgi:hypothetical protein